MDASLSERRLTMQVIARGEGLQDISLINYDLIQ